MRSSTTTSAPDRVKFPRRRLSLIGAVAIVLGGVAIGMVAMHPRSAPAEARQAPVLSVALVRPHLSELPVRVPAVGNVAAWQEASVGSESEGLRLIDVRVNVGDRVRRGQVLALFDASVVDAERAEALASLALSEAQAAEADANAGRAAGLDKAGVLSSQQVDRYLAEAKAAHARRDAARAVERRARLRLAHTRILAPSDGIITARTATVGAVTSAGQELFRLVRDGRLEWRAVVSVAELGSVSPGLAAHATLPDGTVVRGRVRMVSPVIDTGTHSGLAYVDLPADERIRAGVFAKGYLEVGQTPALTLPQGAVVMRDGFHYVMRVGPMSKVVTSKVAVGRRSGDRIEITGGLDASQAVIASGLAFLGEGDVVRVVEAPERRGGP